MYRQNKISVKCVVPQLNIQPEQGRNGFAVINVDMLGGMLKELW